MSETMIQTNDIREVVKLLKVPGASKCRSIDKQFTWEKERGYADRQLREMRFAARELNFEYRTNDAFHSPDGNVISTGEVYSDGTWCLHLQTHYGVTAGDNWFKASVFRKLEKKP